MKLFRINPTEVSEQLVSFLNDGLKATGRAKYVIGLSGGLDSTVCAVLGIKAVGAKNVFGVIMPYATSSVSSQEDAIDISKRLGIESAVINISPIADAYFKMKTGIETLRKDNFLARVRMAVLYDYAAKFHGLVLGTSNKTEALLGYGTIHGDAAWDINPLWDLYKTQVRDLADYLKIPRNIIDKIPTADLWEGQTDEGELGFTYERIDRILYLMIELGYDLKRLTDEGLQESEIMRARQLVKKNQFKRSGPAVARLFKQYPGCDFVVPGDW